MFNELDKLKQLIKTSKNIVFFGGAGVSTASGIPDFRGNGGLYTEPEENEEESPEEILTADYLYRKSARFFSYYRKHMVYPYANPNDAHLALAKLERQGKLIAVVTQNIDGLHQEAGSRKVIELHGSTKRNYCVRCGKEYTLAHVMEAEDVPRCEQCSGTSLTVQPAASLIDEFRGEHLIIINQSPTPYDRYAEYVIREPIEQVLRNLCEE